MGKLTSSPALGSSVSKKAVQNALDGPVDTIAYSNSGSADSTAVNNLILALARLGLMVAPAAGPNLFVSPALGAGVVDNGDGSYTATNGIQMVGISSLVVGTTYTISFDWSSSGTGDLVVNNSATDRANVKGRVAVTTVPATYSLTFVADDPNLWIGADIVSYTGDLLNISVTEVLS